MGGGGITKNLSPTASPAVMSTSPSKPPVNHLHELEMRSALRQKVGRGELTQMECDALITQLESDLTTGVHERVTVSWPDVFATAKALSAAHGSGTLCRSLDTRHVALAMELGPTEFCSSDLRQSRMAAAAGLTDIS